MTGTICLPVELHGIDTEHPTLFVNREVVESKLSVEAVSESALTLSDLEGRYPLKETMKEEGWGVFETLRGGEQVLEIQKNDEAFAFNDDDEAFAFVLAKANAGSECHQQVLALLKECHPTLFDESLAVVSEPNEDGSTFIAEAEFQLIEKKYDFLTASHAEGWGGWARCLAIAALIV